MQIELIYIQLLLIIDFRILFVKPMITARHSSEQKINNQLYQSLKKQKELTNRINVLLLEKEKNLKNIEKRIINSHNVQQHRIQKILKKQELEQSFENSKRTDLYKSQLFKELKRQLSDSIVKKQSQLKQTKQDWYRNMKAIQKENRKKIQLDKQALLQGKKQSKNQVKLTQLCIKQNIRKYWDERLDYIQESKHKDNQRKTILFQTSLDNISFLKQRERQLLQQIRKANEIANNLKSQDQSAVLIQQKPFGTLSVPQNFS